MKKSNKALMAVIALTVSTGIQANANSDDLFGLKNTSSSTDLIAHGGEGKCGEGKCGEGKCGEGKCGEGKCGEGKCGEGKCGEGKDAKKAVKPGELKNLKTVNAKGEPDPKGQFIKGPDGKLIKVQVEKPGAEGKCGEGKCGEGKCGEGKCGTHK